ncbi:hypothetical protein AYI68_g7194 [Smittium mucronatum]|uniref:Uncharacterized protein n=1 Tax=Smittium mucronatum TaxID=133383 RepID=A0A1R0GPF1_9FUNG|nr:hypothetical protein AYI68_g7194 [Smittium mucronatum]
MYQDDIGVKVKILSDLISSDKAIFELIIMARLKGKSKKKMIESQKVINKLNKNHHELLGYGPEASTGKNIPQKDIENF